MKFISLDIYDQEEGTDYDSSFFFIFERRTK
jgi:hypothetical protein|nr:MAG TPA: hypothetical protein [Caudoviricetes sp.]